MPCREQFIAVILNTCYKYLNWPNPGLGLAAYGVETGGKSF